MYNLCLQIKVLLGVHINFIFNKLEQVDLNYRLIINVMYEYVSSLLINHLLHIVADTFYVQFLFNFEHELYAFNPQQLRH